MPEASISQSNVTTSMAVFAELGAEHEDASEVLCATLKATVPRESAPRDSRKHRLRTQEDNNSSERLECELEHGRLSPARLGSGAPADVAFRISASSVSTEMQLSRSTDREPECELEHGRLSPGRLWSGAPAGVVLRMSARSVSTEKQLSRSTDREPTSLDTRESLCGK